MAKDAIIINDDDSVDLVEAGSIKHNASVASQLSTATTTSTKPLVPPSPSTSSEASLSCSNSVFTSIRKMSSTPKRKSLINADEATSSPVIVKNGEAEQIMNSEDTFVPPDGGFQAWLVMLCSFLCNGAIFGIINSYGALFVFLKEGYKDDPDSATKASFVGSLAIGMTFLLSPISSIMIDKFGIRRTSILGAVLAFLGMLFSAFSVERVEALCFTFGIMFGGGASLIYTPSLVILGHYFKKRLGLVNGIVSMGSSIFTMAMPHIMDGLITKVGLKNCFLFLAGMTFLLVISSLNFKPLMPPPIEDEEEKKNKSCIAQIVNVDNWKNRKYLIWSLAVPSALFGYFVPYVHIVAHVKLVMPEENGNTLVTCIAITSMVGRLVFGKVADLPRVNRILLQQISFVSIGICTMLLTAAPYFHGFQFEALIVFSLIMGLFDGCFITMFGPIAYDICGPAGASQAIGFILGMCSLPLTLGPPIAGYLYDRLGNYTVAFIAAGIPPLVGAALMCLIYKVGNVSKYKEVEGGPATAGDNNVNNDNKEQHDDVVQDTRESTDVMLKCSATATTTLEPEDSAVEAESLLDKSNSNGSAIKA